jgi:putative two-component system response regulator
MEITDEILNASILIVDDLTANVQLLELMLRRAGYRFVDSTTDPHTVCALHRANNYDLILLDLQMPEMDGFQLMEDLKKITTDSYLPVFVITIQASYKLRALAAGAKDFISKPFDMAEVQTRIHNMLEVRLLNKKLRNYNQVLKQQVSERTADLQDNYLESILTLTRAAEHKDEDTRTHVQRIGYYGRELARIIGMNEDFVDKIFFASPMHDIGKIGIPDQILLKPGTFTPDEWKVMQGHTTIGAKILSNSKSPYLIMGAEIALNHHEHWDGGGYPNGKRGGTIPLSARVINICDTYDALRSKRPYKPAYGHKKAMHIITRGDERTHPEQFDPAIFAAFNQHSVLFRDIFEAHSEELC